MTTKPHLLQRPFLLPLAIAAFVLATPGPAAAAQGSLTGQVSNAATKDYLEGAIVEVAGANLSTVTDREGRYLLNNVPVGGATLVVSFSGLDAQRIPVVVASGQRLVRDVALTSEIYKLDRFVVAGEREGTSKAEMLQRAAPNVKNVISADSFGQRADTNIANVLENVPGINAMWNDQEATRVSIRGTEAATTTVSFDGQTLAASSAGAAREFHFDVTSVGNIESIELTKAATPDMAGASVGGNVNLITRSAFDRTRGRIIQYAAGLTHQPTHQPHTPAWKEPIDGFGPFGHFSYTDVLGASRDIGIAFTTSYHINPGTFDRSILQYGLATANRGPTPITRSIRRAASSHRVRFNVGNKFDFRWSENTVVGLNLSYNLSQTDANSYTMDGVTPSSLAVVNAEGNRASGGNISPNFGDGITRFFPATNHTWTLNSIGASSLHRTYIFNPSLRHRRDGLEVFSGLSYSNARSGNDPNSRPSGTVDARINNVGVTLDQTGDPRWPIIRQTSGANMYDLNNYQALAYQLTPSDTGTRSKVLSAKFDLKKDLPLALPTFVKSGLAFDQHKRALSNDSTRFTYTGADGILGNADDRLGLGQFLDGDTWDTGHADYQKRYRDPGGLIPFASSYGTARHRLDNPGLWVEDRAFALQSNLQGNRSLKEEILAAYFMGNVRIREVSVLGGVRMEETRVQGEGSLNYISPEERARRAAWVGAVTEVESLRRVQAQYGNRGSNKGEYRNHFPSIHLKYEPFDGFITRASWSVGIGRPAFGSIIPNETVNDDNQTVTASNPALKPQFTDSYDLSFEYYLPKQGMASVGLFRKDITDYIFTDNSQIIGTGQDNGFDGQYAGYRLTTSSNRGNAIVEGLELSYQQQLTFLPAWLRGFGFNASFTFIRTEGNYGSDVTATNASAPTNIARNFLPRAGAAGLSYRGHNLELRLNAVYRGAYPYTPHANPWQREFRKDRLMLNWKSRYNFSRQFGIFFDVDNLSRAPVSDNYFLYPERAANHAGFHPKIQFGVSGRL